MKKLFLLLFAFSFTADSAVYEIGREYIQKHNFKTIYDILEKLPVLYGVSYGRTGQPVTFWKNANSQSATKVYLDSLLVNDAYSGLSDFSDLSVEKIDKIIINDSPVEAGGLRVDLLTLKKSTKTNETDVFYNDAYFNHRDLAFSVRQNFTENSSFRIFAQITDYMDQRDVEDIDFKTPYEKQDYAGRIDLPDFGIIKPELEGGFFRKKLNACAFDSIKVIEENYFFTLRASLPVYIEGFSNRITGGFQKKVNFQKGFLNADRYIATADLFWQRDNLHIFANSNLNIIDFYQNSNRSDCSETFGFKWQPYLSFNFSNENYLSYNDIKDFSGGSSIKAALILPAGFDLNWQTTYFSGIENSDLFRQSSEKLTNRLEIGNKTEFDQYHNYISANMEIVKDYQNNCDNPLYQTGIRAKTDWKSMIDLSVWFTTLLNNKSQAMQSDYSLTSDLNYRQKFYNDQLTINLNITHRYARFFPGYADNLAEYLNNLAYKISAKIIDCEIFYGADNFLPGTFVFDAKEYKINKHYNYQTIPGYDMMGKDEVWGVRWSFYR